ncbi:MAG: hypothetical protein EHM91_06575 [Planctomycetota bacterium]|nr:MAG: hypothetical protein EHM91_06575 [Planctomycetota bacterium]
MSASRNDQRTCSACSNELDSAEGVELWGSWFCSKCFVGQATDFGRELKPEELQRLRRLGRELAGFLPPDLLEMILVGFYKRSSGSKKPPDKAELHRAVGELQRVTATACFRQILSLLKTWDEMFGKFVHEQEAEIREKVRRLTDLEGT